MPRDYDAYFDERAAARDAGRVRTRSSQAERDAFKSSPEYQQVKARQSAIAEAVRNTYGDPYATRADAEAFMADRNQYGSPADAFRSKGGVGAPGAREAYINTRNANRDAFYNKIGVNFPTETTAGNNRRSKDNATEQLVNLPEKRTGAFNPEEFFNGDSRMAGDVFSGMYSFM